MTFVPASVPINDVSTLRRTLRYDVYVLQPWSPEPCDFRLDQTIPAGAYVDTDQLDELQRLSRLDYSTDASPVDVERSASQSAPFVVRLYGNSSSLMSTITMPVHFRYHTAAAQRFDRQQDYLAADHIYTFLSSCACSSQVSVAIEPPRMFMRSCNAVNAQLLQQLQPDAIDAAAALRRGGRNVAGDDDNDDKASRALWLPVDDYELHSDPIVVGLPIGRLSVQPLVMFVTLAFAWAACYGVVREMANSMGDGLTACD